MVAIHNLYTEQKGGIGAMGNWDMQLAYLQEVYKKLDKLGENQNKETWLVKSNIDKKLYIWKEIELEMTVIYQKLKMVSS